MKRSIWFLVATLIASLMVMASLNRTAVAISWVLVFGFAVCLCYSIRKEIRRRHDQADLERFLQLSGEGLFAERTPENMSAIQERLELLNRSVDREAMASYSETDAAEKEIRQAALDVRRKQRDDFKRIAEKFNWC